MQQSQSAWSRPANMFLLLCAVFIGYFMFGVSENIKGPALPRVQDEFGISELSIGFVLSLNSVGFLLACSFAGILVRRIGLRAGLLIGFGGMAASGLLFGTANGAAAFAFAFFFLNLCNGLLEISLGYATARLFTKNTGFMMNLSHFFYGFSSMLAPIAATFAMGWSPFGAEHALGWRGMFILMLAVCALPMLPAALARFPGDASKADKGSGSAGGGKQGGWRVIARDPIAWFVVVMLSLGMMAEITAGSWLVIYMEKTYGWANVRASTMLSAFFLCFTAARLVLGPVTDRIGFVKSIIVFAGFAGVCSVVAVLTGESAAWLLAVAGIGIGPIYPTVMAFLAKRYADYSDTAISFTVTMIGIFGVLGNFAIGAIFDLFGYEAGYYTAGGCALLCAAAAAVLFAKLKARGQLL